MMRMLTCALAIASTQALAQVTIQFTPPSIVFEAAPRLVVVEPGLQVVEDYDEEVFFVNGYYWHQRDGRWFRTRDWHGGWGYVEPVRVPRMLVRVPPGHYKHWRGPSVIVGPKGPHGKIKMKHHRH